MDFILATTTRNEGLYLPEWILHHRQLGFNRVVVFSNDNDDGSDDMLRELQKEELIEWRPREGCIDRNPQLLAFKELSKELLGLSRKPYPYLAWLDCDEFLVLKKHDTVDQWLADLGYPDGVMINWKHFGSSGIYHYDSRPTVERFVLSDQDTPLNRLYKCIARCDPALYTQINNHRPVRQKGCKPKVVYSCLPVKSVPEAYINGKSPISDDDAPIYHGLSQLNHYALRSEEEYLWKSLRGNGRVASEKALLTGESNYFNKHNCNRDIDTFASDKYLSRLKEELERLPFTIHQLQNQITLTKRHGTKRVFRQSYSPNLPMYNILSRINGSHFNSQLLNSGDAEAIKQVSMALRHTEPELSLQLMLVAKKMMPFDRHIGAGIEDLEVELGKRSWSDISPNAPVSDLNHIYFIHIPKTGGTEVCASNLFQHRAAGHTSYRKMKRILGKAIEYYRGFTLSRNPWDRLFSAFQYLSAGGTGNRLDKSIQKEFLDRYQGDFRGFLVDFVDRPGDFINILHFRPMATFVSPSKIESPFMYHHLEDIGNRSGLEEFLGLRLSISHPEKTIEREKGAKYFTDSQIMAVAQIYSDDIEEFGYGDYDYRSLAD